MPDLISLPWQVVSQGHPAPFWIALKLHFVPRPLPSKGQAHGNDNRWVFSRRFNASLLMVKHENLY